MAKERYTWLIKRKSFVQLIGAEYHLLKKSGSNSILKFYIAAITIVLILLLTICSIFYATEMLFHLPQVEVLLAAFISILFVFIYIFLLNTFSKQIRTDKGAEKEGWGKRLKMANVVRVGFVVFMAFLIAKPVEIFVFRERLTPKVEAHRLAMFKSYKEKIESLNSTDLQKTLKKLTSYQQQYQIYPSPAIEQQIQTLNSQLLTIQASQANNFNTANQRIQASDFLLFRIQTAAYFPLAWLICVAIITLFLVPGILIYSISNNDTYYKLKQDWETKLISEEYGAFLKWYIEIFKEKFNLDRACYSVFEDPPFNQKRKPKPAFQSQSDFLKKFSGD